VLDSVTQYLIANPQVGLEVQGHTDNIGGPDFNLALSQRRATSVKSYLVSAGIDPSRLTTRGYGLSMPVANNATSEGRADNRRVALRSTPEGPTWRGRQETCPVLRDILPVAAIPLPSYFLEIRISLIYAPQGAVTLPLAPGRYNSFDA